MIKFNESTTTKIKATIQMVVPLLVMFFDWFSEQDGVTLMGLLDSSLAWIGAGIALVTGALNFVKANAKEARGE